MDRKTFEYMRARAIAYEGLESEKQIIISMKKSIDEIGVVEIRLYCWTPTVTKEAKKHIKEYILKALDERLSEIEKEMEEI